MKQEGINSLAILHEDDKKTKKQVKCLPFSS